MTNDSIETVDLKARVIASTKAGIADNLVRRPANPRAIVLLYGAARRCSCMVRERLKRYRK